MSGAIQTITGTGPAPVTMSSREIADLTGKDLSHVNRDIRAMLDSLVDDPELDHVREDKDGRGYTTAFHLGRELTYTLLSGYSVPLRRRVVARWQELEAQVAGPLALTPAEMFLQNAQAMVAVERRQLAQAQELARISESVDTLMTGSMTLTERPANSEAITHIRPRMLKKYQLPARIVDLVMRQMPYSPKPAGMVRNHREEAQGASYAVYWVKDVNTTFSRFVRDCKRVTATKVTHPDIDERFTLAPGAEG